MVPKTNRRKEVESASRKSSPPSSQQAPVHQVGQEEGRRRREGTTNLAPLTNAAYYANFQSARERQERQEREREIERGSFKREAIFGAEEKSRDDGGRSDD